MCQHHRAPVSRRTRAVPAQLAPGASVAVGQAHAALLLHKEFGVQRASRLDCLQDVDHLARADAECVEALDDFGQGNRILDKGEARATVLFYCDFGAGQDDLLQ